MSKLNNIMIDFESTDTAATTKILSVGMVYFDPKTGEVGDKYYIKFNPNCPINAARTESQSTMEWWDTLPPHIKQEAFSGTDPVETLLVTLDHLADGYTRLWGNGATFDITILENIYAQVNRPLPYKFWNVRDVRTVLDMGRTLANYQKPTAPKDAHNPIVDCDYQIEYVSAIYKMLGK